MKDTVKLFIQIALLAAATWLCSGCSAERHIVGKWTTKPTEEQESAGNPMANAASSLAVVELEIRKDKTFTMNMFGTNVDGTWTYEDDVLKLSMTKAGGYDMSSFAANKPLIGALSEDKSRLEFKTEQGALTSSLSFNRVES